MNITDSTIAAPYFPLMATTPIVQRTGTAASTPFMKLVSAAHD
jgi:hypothetical protein